MRLQSAVGEFIRDRAKSLRGQTRDLDGLMDLIGEAPIVLLGEATHGSDEFYRMRCRITRRLISEKGFTAVAVEADWPDAYRVNRFVRHLGADRTADQALGDFRRFPQWMWRNTVMVDFIESLRLRNQGRPAGEQVGFYGLDLYSLFTSIEAVVAYLAQVDPAAAAEARGRYACFEQARRGPQEYGLLAANLDQSCRDGAIRQLVQLRLEADAYLRRDGLAAQDEQFYAEQNALVVRDAEEYYRSMFTGRINTWNLRDRHMAETLASLARHLSSTGRQAKIVVWEHNSHIGDARATEMGNVGEFNVGQLARQSWGRQAALVGFTTYEGSVSAASEWDGPVERKRVRPAREDSYEHLFHQARGGDFFLPLRDASGAGELDQERLERMIGVIYVPQSERCSHYFNCRIAGQFDALIHLDRTTALTPLEYTPLWERGELPETFPSGL